MNSDMQLLKGFCSFASLLSTISYWKSTAVSSETRKFIWNEYLKEQLSESAAVCCLHTDIQSFSKNRINLPSFRLVQHQGFTRRECLFFMSRSLCSLVSISSSLPFSEDFAALLALYKLACTRKFRKNKYGSESSIVKEQSEKTLRMIS